MNYVAIMGRLTKDPEVRYSNEMAIARYTIAVDRPTKDKQTDFISCVAFGKAGEFAVKYLRKGVKILVEGRIQTGSYTNKDGNKVYTTDVVINAHHFCESKTAEEKAPAAPDDFMNVAEGIDDGVPFK